MSYNGTMSFNIPNPKLTAKNPHFGNKYAPLDEVLRVIAPFLEEHKLDIQQTVVDGLFVTRLTDNVDNKVVREVAFPFVTDKQSPQAVGSALTYARRYGIILLFNLVGEEDDDGEVAERPFRKKKTTPKAKPAADKKDW